MPIMVKITKKENIMKILKDYFRAKEEILKYFGWGYGTWCDYQLEDSTDYYWKLNKSQTAVLFSEDESDLKNSNDCKYMSDICRQRGINSSIYPREDYTLIFRDTGEGVKLLSVFDNSKERK